MMTWQCSAQVLSASERAASATTPILATTLSGIITDPSGALVQHATLEISSSSSEHQASPAPSSVMSEIFTDAAGHFTTTLPPGTYIVSVSSLGFDPATRKLVLGTRPITLDIRLNIATTTQQVDVLSDATSSTAAGDNRNALVFRGDQLNTLSNNDSTLQQQVLAMAGGGGEGGGQVYVDGFSGGRFPPKDTIREIRINQNPFSSQYEDLGYGRVEIFTKPGSDKVHGSIFSSGSTNAFNSLNPYAGAQPPYNLLYNRGDFSGPLGKKTSAFFSGTRNDQQNNAVVNAFNPDGSRLSIAVPAPTTDIDISLRIDRQLNASNTLVSRYDYSKSDATNSGVGLLVLPSEGSNSSTTVQTLQVGNTQLIGPKIVSETRFQYLRTRLSQSPISTAPTIVVQGAFNGGGSPTQASQDSKDQFEFQEYLSFVHGNHFLRAGVRYRLLHEVNFSTANYNGEFTFPTLAAYQAGIPSLFSLTAGESTARLVTGDLGAYAEDEWKIRKNLTAVFGLRIESQTAIPDHFDPAPRAGISWAAGQTDKHPPIVTIRTNAGIFYDRFAPGNILTSIRQNGTSQQAFILTNPSFYPVIPSAAQLSGTAPTPYSISPHLHVASEIIGSLSVERSLGKDGKLGSVSATYYAVRGVHQYNSENINAPVGSSGIRPIRNAADVYQFASNGIQKAQSFNVNVNLQPTKQLSLFAFYSARRQMSDTFGAASFPSQPYDVSADYGPSGLGSRPVGQRLFADADLKLPFNFSADVFLATNSRSRFNITTGTDRNNDTQFNDRPAFATSPGSTSILYTTPFGTFDANPQPGEAIIPYNYGLAPRLIFTAAGVKRDFKFGPQPSAPAAAADAKPDQPPPPRPDPAYNLSFGLDAVNVLNTNNPGTPIGVLSSPFFGHALSTNSFFGLTSAANRVIFLSTTFSF